MNRISDLTRPRTGKRQRVPEGQGRVCGLAPVGTPSCLLSSGALSQGRRVTITRTLRDCQSPGQPSHCTDAGTTIQSQQPVNKRPQGVDHVTPAPPPAHPVLWCGDKGVAPGRQELRGGEVDTSSPHSCGHNDARGPWDRGDRVSTRPSLS